MKFLRTDDQMCLVSKCGEETKDKITSDGSMVSVGI